LAPAIGGPYVGTATTRPQSLAGKKLLVNAVTQPDGELRVELLDNGRNVIPGFSRSDCHPLQGDHHAAKVSWKGGAEIPESATKLRFVLNQAYLYGFAAEDSENR
jgi:hypothetical protein